MWEVLGFIVPSGRSEEVEEKGRREAEADGDGGSLLRAWGRGLCCLCSRNA